MSTSTVELNAEVLDSTDRVFWYLGQTRFFDPFREINCTNVSCADCDSLRSRQCHQYESQSSFWGVFECRGWRHWKESGQGWSLGESSTCSTEGEENLSYSDLEFPVREEKLHKVEQVSWQTFLAWLFFENRHRLRLLSFWLIRIFTRVHIVDSFWCYIFWQFFRTNQEKVFFGHLSRYRESCITCKILYTLVILIPMVISIKRCVTCWFSIISLITTSMLSKPKSNLILLLFD